MNYKVLKSINQKLLLNKKLRTFRNKIREKYI